jgi:glycosyltransferase involved in cell wall biosynthesis
MKILLSAYACEPNRGSEPGNGWNWALETARLGYEVWCLTTPEGKENIEAELNTVNELNLHIVYVTVPDWVEKAYRYQPGVYLHYIMWQEQAYKVAKKLSNDISFDVVHHITLGSLQMSSAMWRLNKPLIFGPVGGGQKAPVAFKKYFYHWWRMEVIRDFVSSMLVKFNPNVRKTMRTAAKVLVTNEDTYKLAKANGAASPEMFLDTSLPESFYPEKLPVRNTSGPLKILWVGRVYPRKGLPLVLEALSKVRKDVNYELTIIGDGPAGYMIPEWLELYGLSKKVTVKGQVTWDEVQRAYETHDLFFFCSLRDSFASQYLEAMAYGLPLITLNLYGVKEFIPDNAAIKVNPTTPERTCAELAKAVEFFYDNPEQLKRYGESAFQYAKEHTFNKKIEQISLYYNTYAPSEREVLQND